MSRVSEILNRLELVAHKMAISVEEAVEILEGKHADKVVVPAAMVTALNSPLEEGAKRAFVSPHDADGNLRNYTPGAASSPSTDEAANASAELAAAGIDMGSGLGDVNAGSAVSKTEE